MTPSMARAQAAEPYPELTVREFALAERVTERTVRRWIAKGALAVRYTAGGGIRILERRQDHRTT